MFKNRYILFLAGGTLAGSLVHGLLSWLKLGFESGIAVVTAAEVLLIVAFCIISYQVQRGNSDECE